nr:MAG TPA: hypothetical protein [Caudoviricetes sp.]
MAIFTQDTADSSKIESYLYELNENLTYMFNNLTPEENYSEAARLIYAQRGERLASVEVKADQIELRVEDNEKHYNTSITLLSDLLSLKAETPSGSSSMELSGDRIKLTTGKFEVDATNLKIDAAGNGTFSGTVSAAKIIGGTIDGASINSTNSDIPFRARRGYVSIGDFICDDSYGRNIFQSDDEVTGMSTGDVVGTGRLLFWAGWDGSQATLSVNGQGRTDINGTLYYNGQTIRSYIKNLVGSLSGGGSSPGDSTDDSSSGGPTGDGNDLILGGGS